MSGYIEVLTPNLNALEKLRIGERDEDLFYIELREGEGVLLYGKKAGDFIFWDVLMERNFGLSKAFLKHIGCKHPTKFNKTFRKWLYGCSPMAKEWLLVWKAAQLQDRYFKKGQISPPYEQLLEEAKEYFENLECTVTDLILRRESSQLKR